MKKTLVLALVLSLIIPTVYAQIYGCCGNPAVTDPTNNFCSDAQITKQVCCSGDDQCEDNLFVENAACFDIPLCDEDDGCLICEVKGAVTTEFVDIFADTEAQAISRCLNVFGGERWGTFNASSPNEAACEAYAETIEDVVAINLLGEVELDPENTEKTITITGGINIETIVGQGEFQVQILPGPYSIVASAEGYTPVTLVGSTQNSKSLPTITLRGVTKSTLQGYVKDNNDNPVTAIVIVNPGPNELGRASTGSGGSYILPNLPFGTYTVVARSDSGASATKQVTLASETTNLNLTVEVGKTLIGFVRNTNDEPLEGINISIPGVGSDSTASSGAYSIDNIPPESGPWIAYVTDPAGVYESQTWSFSVTTIDLDHDFILYTFVEAPPAGEAELTINLTDLSSRQPIGGASVSVYPFASDTPIIGTTNSQGLVSFDLDVKAYQVIILEDDYEQYQDTIALEQDKQENIKLKTRDLYHIEGQVTNAEDTNEEISGVTVRTGDIDDDTTSSGDYDLYDVPQGQRTLSVSHPGYIPKTRTIILSGDTIEDFQLTPKGCTSLEQLTKPNILDISQEGDKVIVSWSNECYYEDDYYGVFLCEGAACAPEIKVDQPPESPYTHEEIEGETTYGYVIQSHYSQPESTQDSDIGYITTGDSVCLTNTGRFCTDEVTVSQCVDNYAEVYDDCTERPGEVCVNGQCQYPSPCTLCSRPFGIFSIPIQDIEATAGALIFTPCDDIDFCYLDYTDSSVDEYGECSDIFDCYSYRSKDSCEVDKCAISDAQNCEWIDSEYSELGQGVCRPVNQEEQDCNRCSADQVYNDLFGACRKDTCNLYGNCYYKETNPKKGCWNEDQVECWMYEEQEYCTNGIPVEVDVDWTEIADPNYKFDGTNTLTRPSNDTVGKGLCRWNHTMTLQDSETRITFACFKDADESNFPDCTTSGTLCARDFEYPLTLVQYTDMINEFNFPYFTTDNIDEEEEIDTYFCVAKEGDSCYFIQALPDYIATNYPRNKATAGMLAQPTNPHSEDGSYTDGIYHLYTFSEDSSRNLEPVQRITVELDTTAPEITIDVLKDFYVSHGSQLTEDIAINLDLVIDPNKPNEDVFCSGSLARSDGYPVSAANSSSEYEPLTEWSYFYPGFVGDGEYTFTYTCYDGAGNEITQEEEILIDPDNAIYDPTRDTFNYFNNIPIFISTEEAANCQYSENHITWDNLNPIDASKTTHSTNVNLVPMGNWAHKTYYVRCTFDKSGRTLYGTPGTDDIIIVVDQQPPQTKTYKYDYSTRDFQLHDLSGGVWINSQTNSIKLECEDQDIIGREFGCEEPAVYYCNKTIGPSDCTPSPKAYDPFVPFISDSSKICFQSVDAGTNQENVKCAEIRLDIIRPDIQNITIKDPNLQEINGSTRSSDVFIEGQIYNPINHDCECVSPIDEIYATINDGAPINITHSGYLDITFSKKLVLLKNQENFIKIFAVDKAGNPGNDKLTSIIQDSQGPSISDITIESPELPYGSSGNAVQFGFDSVISVGNVIDDVIASEIDEQDQIARVKSVWIEDIFGKTTKLSNNDSIDKKEWIGEIKTRDWPFGSSTITVYSEDILGNVNSIPYVVYVGDNVKPEGSLTIENPEGFIPPIVGAGKYYVILNVSEPLNEIRSFTYTISGETRNLTLLARTKQGNRWLASFDMIPNKDSTATFNILMEDEHGVLGNQLDNKVFSVNSILPKLRDINRYVYEKTLSNVEHEDEDYSPDTKYVVRLNGETIDNAETSISNLKLRPGENELYIRVKNVFGSTVERDYNVFYDGYTPKVTEFSPETEAQEGIVRVVVGDKSPSSGLSNETILTIENSTGVVGTVLATPGTNHVFQTILGNGTYTATIEGEDNAGNELESFTWTFEIKPNASAITGIPVIIDPAPPQFILEHKQYTRPGAQFIINAIIENDEPYALDGATTINGASLPISRHTEELYEFIWNVPNAEGTYNISTTLTDIKGHTENKTGSVIVDNTVPEIETLDVDLINVELINNTELTRNNTIRFQGTIENPESDLNVYVERNGERFDGSVTGNTFNVPVTLLGTHMAETVNSLTLTFIDRAGNQRSRSFIVIKDLKPPELIELTVAR
ncbi:carboxypeptidase regulatory-like domain-containing protein [Nanoarchaeota archaeon]